MTEASKKDIESIVKAGDVLAGKYLVDRVLGVGGMGVVVAATHTQLDQRVAIKFLLPSMVSNRDVVERFQREARAAAKIRSEHVVRVSDVGTMERGVPYIVMEFLEGGDLGELLSRRGVLPVALAVDYMLEACEALAEAHAAGVVHRDLKPANLFLARRADESEIVKVLDFGISKQVSMDALQSSPSLTKTTDVFGSPTYMSPEQLKASRDVDMRADIWAIGVILYELLTSKPPFGGGTVAEIFGAILHQPAPRLREGRKDAPAELEKVLLRCLDKDTARRFQNVGELAEALMPFGSEAARESTARVSRVLRASGPNSRMANRPSQGGSRPSSPSIEPPHSQGAVVVVQAHTGVDGDKAARPPSGGEAESPASPGSATSTSWGHVRPTSKPTSTGRLVLVALGVLVAAGGGALLALKLMTGGGGGATTSSSAASADPGRPTAEVTAASSGSTVVVPAPTTAASVEAPPATPSATASAKASSGGAAPRPTGKVPGTATPAVTASATASTKPTAPSAPTGDDDFGGRR